MASMSKTVCCVCGSGFEVRTSEIARGKGRCCSKACAAKLSVRPDQAGDRNPNWKGGVKREGKHKRYIEQYPERNKAHREMTNAIRRGDLTRQPCELCGVEKVDGHHDDYSKPLEVRWLCRTHHMRSHASKTSRAKQKEGKV